MSKELEALEPSVVLKFVDDLLKRYEGKTDYNIYITKDWLLEIKQSLKRLESIENSNPSEALECLEKLKGMEISSMPFSDEYGTQEVDLNDIRKVGSQLNTDFREYIDTIKQALLKQQEPKHYLKWEDLEFDEDGQETLVLLNGTKYRMYYYKGYDECINLFTEDETSVIHMFEGCYSQDKQFFNDLRLEMVEE